jgi:hypothetical protein
MASLESRQGDRGASTLREAGAELERWLGAVLGCPVLLTSAGQPLPGHDGDGSRAVLCWLGVKSVVVRPLERWTRITAQLEYLLYFEGGHALEQHAQLEAVLVAAALADVRCSPAPAEAAWWSALGTPLRPALSIAREVATDTAPREAAPPARQVLANAAIARMLGGRVVLPSGEPCAGATVRVSGGPGRAVTGNDGRFRVIAARGDAPVSLKLTHPAATGLRVQLDESD